MSWAVVFLSTFYYFCEWQMSNILRIFTITMDQDFDKINKVLTDQGFKLKSCEFDSTIVYISILLLLPLTAAVFFLFLYQTVTHPELETFSTWWEYPIMMIVFCCELLKQKKILSPNGKIHVYDYIDKMGFAVFYKDKEENNQ